MRGGFVYMMSNRQNGTLYIGVTADLVRRVHQHRTGEGSDFVRRYDLNRLVWSERHEDIVLAIQREKTLKDWPRAWKIRLIQRMNPNWDDLYPSLV
jgi:putative endonuclease